MNKNVLALRELTEQLKWIWRKRD